MVVGQFQIEPDQREVIAGGKLEGRVPEFALRQFPGNRLASTMIITLPDDPALAAMGEAEIRIDLACGAYAAGHLSRQGAADVAGVSRYEFDQALYRRRIPTFTEEMLAQDLETLRLLDSK